MFFYIYIYVIISKTPSNNIKSNDSNFESLFIHLRIGC